MTRPPPDFDELIGGDLEPEERARLERVHELLIEAGPPPALRSSHAVALRQRPRRVALIAAAVALGLGIFAAGLLAGSRGDGRGTFRVVTMTGTAYTTGVSASLTIFDVDDAGNWPMELAVEGLVQSAGGRPYELWLTRHGELAAQCGSFLAEADGTTVVPLNAPYKLRDFDGWVVVVEGSKSPLLTT